MRGVSPKGLPWNPEFLAEELNGNRNKPGYNPQVPYDDYARIKASVASPKPVDASPTTGSPQGHEYGSGPQMSLTSTLEVDSPYFLASYGPHTVNLSGPH